MSTEQRINMDSYTIIETRLLHGINWSKQCLLICSLIKDLKLCFRGQLHKFAHALWKIYKIIEVCAPKTKERRSYLCCTHR